MALVISKDELQIMVRKVYGKSGTITEQPCRSSKNVTNPCPEVHLGISGDFPPFGTETFGCFCATTERERGLLYSALNALVIMGGEVFECKNCGTEFRGKIEGGRPRHYCKEQCRLENGTKKRKAKR